MCFLQLTLHLVADDAEAAEPRGQIRVRHPLDQALGAQPVLDQLLDPQHGDLVTSREPLQLRQLCHPAVALHDLAEHGPRLKPRQTAEVGAGLRVAGSHQDAAIA